MITPLNTRWNILFYALMLAFFWIIVAYILFSKWEFLISNLRNQIVSSQLSKNLNSKTSLAITYDLSLNADGSGFTNTKTCPEQIILTNTSSGITIFSTPSTAKYNSGGIYCFASYTGTTVSSGNILISYNSGYTSFSSMTYNGNSLTVGGSPLQSTSFVWSWGYNYQFTLSWSNTYSNLDADGNSDNYSAASSGSTLYPDNMVDNDALWRQVVFWYIKKQTGFITAFWSNSGTNSYIQWNSLNNYGPYDKIGNTSSGYLFLTFDQPCTIKIVEFDRLRHSSRKELISISQTGGSITSASGGYGYLQSNWSLTGSYWNTGASLTNALSFDFKNKDYAVFIAYNGNSSNTGADFLRYQIKAVNNSGMPLFITPIQYKAYGEVTMLSNDILINKTGEFMGMQEEVTKKNGNSSQVGALATTNSCTFNSSTFPCNIYDAIQTSCSFGSSSFLCSFF